jgi:hypothetical protein
MINAQEKYIPKNTICKKFQKKSIMGVLNLQICKYNKHLFHKLCDGYGEIFSYMYFYSILYY